MRINISRCRIISIGLFQIASPSLPVTRETFNSLIDRLESTWHSRPTELWDHTAHWVALGYVSLLLSLLSGLLMMVIGTLLFVQLDGFAPATLAFAILFAGLGLAGFVLKCLWVRFEAPAGLALEERDHPELHRLIRELCGRAGTVHFDQVILDPEMNASSVQNPRLGIFGWHRTYLVIGLPLMESLSMDELKAVIAHEVAHLSRSDGKLGTWLHRTRTSWERIADHAGSRALRPLLGGFFNWFWPHLNSRAYVLLRSNELEADRASAAWAPPEFLASGLKRLAIQSQRADDRFWDPLEQQFGRQGDLPDDVMWRFSEFLRTPTDPRAAEEWLAKAIARPSDTIDSHPGLATRLSNLASMLAVGNDPPPPLPAGTTAAERLLPPATVESALRKFSAEWRSDVRATSQPAGTDLDAPRRLGRWRVAVAEFCRIDTARPEAVPLIGRRRPDSR